MPGGAPSGNRAPLVFRSAEVGSLGGETAAVALKQVGGGARVEMDRASAWCYAP